MAEDVPSRGLSAGLPASDSLVTAVSGVLGTMREHRGGPKSSRLPGSPGAWNHGDLWVTAF